jgi:tubby and related proteins
MSKLSESSIVAARLARAKQSNKESGKEEVVLTGAAMHGLSQRDATEDTGGQQGSSSSAGAGPLESEQRDMMAQMQQAQEELELQQKRLEQQRLSQAAGPSVVLATGASPGDANAMAIPPEWLLQPAERGAPMVQCLIKREKGALGLWPIYRMYLQRDNGDVFVLAARRRKGVLSEGHSFLISRDEKDLEKGPNYVGKLRSNLIGTEWMLYDSGANPVKLQKALNSPRRSGSAERLPSDGPRRELAYLSSQQNVVGAAAPRRLRVTLPQLDETGRQPRMRAPASKQETLPSLARSKQLSCEELIFLANKEATPNPLTGRHSLNFNGRVAKASVKNFQIESPAAPGAVVLQFGKAAKEDYILDYGYPFSPLQALALALSALAYKLANEGG